MYFAAEPLNEADSLLAEVPENERGLLVVEFQDVNGIPSGEFPIVLVKFS